MNGVVGKGSRKRKLVEFVLLASVLNEASSLVLRPLSRNTFHPHCTFSSKRSILRKKGDVCLYSTIEMFENADKLSKNSTGMAYYLADTAENPSLLSDNQGVEDTNTPPLIEETPEQIALSLLEEHDVKELVSDVLSPNEPISADLDRVLEQTPNMTESNIDHSYGTPYEMSEAKSAVPKLLPILRFALAATGVWLCSPILSMIDTSAVGLLSGT